MEKVTEKVERGWRKLNKMFKKKTIKVPAQPKYYPKVDQKYILKDKYIKLYQSYLEILRWTVKLGRIDLCMVAGVMAGFLMPPSTVHLWAVLKIFYYCKK